MSCILCGESNPLGGSFCSNCEEMERRYWERKNTPPEPTTEDYCAAAGHELYGLTNEGPRCYCGERTEFTQEELAGGPKHG